MKSRERLFSVVFYFCFLQLLLFSEGTDPIVLTDTFTYDYVTHYAGCLYDANGSYSIGDVSSPELANSFTPMNTAGYVSKKDRNIWLRFTVENETENEKVWYLEYAYLKNGVELELYLPSENGSFEVKRAYPGMPSSELDMSYRHYIFRLNLAPHETSTLYLNARVYSDLRLVMKIWHPVVFLNNVRAEQLFIGIFLGVMVVMAVYNLFLFLSFRDVSYAWYILFLLSLLVLQLNNHNLISEWIPAAAHIEEIIVTLFKLFSFTGFLLFSRSFLNIKSLFPSVDRFLKIIILTVLGTGFLTFAFEPFRAINNVLLGGSGLIIVILSIFILVKGNRTAIFFLTAMASMIGIGMLAMVPEEIFYIKAIDFLVPFYIDIGSLMMIVLFSFGLAYRINLLRKEKEQADRLKELDAVKSRFFANVTHEFRTPLTLIMGPLEDLLQESDDPERKGKVEMMLRNSDRLLRLVNQFLDLSRLESGKSDVHASETDLCTFVQGITANFPYLCEKKQLNLSFMADSREIPVYFDREKMEKICLNLLINAVKFTPPGGDILIRCGKTDKAADRKLFPEGYAEICAANTSRAMSREQLDKLFDYFYQTDSASEHAQAGSGIGLALVKDLVALHHGTIEVANREDAPGGRNMTEFVIRLPLGKRHFKTVELDRTNAPVREFPSPAYLRDLYSGSQTSENADTDSQTSSREDGGRDCILVVDDSEEMRTYLKEGLQDEYDMIEAADGEEGLRKARERIPDLIICDLMMPGIGGYEVTRTLKKDIGTSHIPIVLLTAQASEEGMIGGLESGADDYITKPFSMNIVKIRIRNLIGLRQDLQEKMRKRLLLQPAELSFTSIDRKFLEDLHAGIENNLSDPDFSIDRLSELLFISRATLNRKVRALTGNSTNQYIQSYRLKRAAQMLLANYGNITEVCFAVGFSNSAYFTKCFKETFHQLPSRFQTVRAL